MFSIQRWVVVSYFMRLFASFLSSASLFMLMVLSISLRVIVCRYTLLLTECTSTARWMCLCRWSNTETNEKEWSGHQCAIAEASFTWMCSTVSKRCFIAVSQRGIQDPGIGEEGGGERRKLDRLRERNQRKMVWGGRKLQLPHSPTEPWI